MLVLLSMGGYMLAAEAIEALEADEQSLRMGLNHKTFTVSLKQRTH